MDLEEIITMNNKKGVIINIDSHTEKDFLPLYKYLVSEYRGGSDCPILLLTDNTDSLILKDETCFIPNEMIFLNRNSGTLLRDIKKMAKRRAEILASPRGMETMVSHTKHHHALYRIMVMICEALHIPAPALYIADQMPDKCQNLSGATFPGNVDYCTDIFIKSEGSDTASFCCEAKALIHELRHVWQHKYRPELFDGYFEYKLSNKDAYALQPAEIDANAYSFLLMKVICGIDMDAFGVPDKERKLIEKRIHKIQEEMYEEENIEEERC